MKQLSSLASVAAIFLFASSSLAQSPAGQPTSETPATTDAPPPLPPAPSASPAPAARPTAPPPGPGPGEYNKPAEDPDAPPRASTGFQMAVRTGVQLPFGNLAGNSRLADGIGPQVPIHLEIGGKVIPNLFLGGYLGFAFGGAGSTLADVCDCVSVNLRLGAEIQYHIAPEEKVNPWIGYGIGIESVAVGNGRTTVSAAGPEFAHFMGGVDFRLSKTLGIGPVIDFSMGQYSRATVKRDGVTTSDGDITNTAMHQWLSLGGRLVFFP